jgi:hypothetical protein
VNHARHVIREAVVALLAAGGTAAGSRVYEHPSDPREDFPALQVEDVGEQQQAPSLPGGPDRTIHRELMLEVTAELLQVGQYARARDQLLADVERLIAYAAIPGVKYIVPAGYVPDQIATEGEAPITVGRQRFRVFYVTTQGDPSATL